METAEHREPYESRGSRTDLGAPGGESPPGDSTWAAVAVDASERPQWVWIADLRHSRDERLGRADSRRSPRGEQSARHDPFGHSPFADLRLSVPLTECGIECLRETIADERAARHAPPHVEPPK
jgi:hypothetical protein